MEPTNDLEDYLVDTEIDQNTCQYCIPLTEVFSNAMNWSLTVHRQYQMQDSCNPAQIQHKKYPDCHNQIDHMDRENPSSFYQTVLHAPNFVRGIGLPDISPPNSSN